jgi:hypothetical protein
MTNEPKYHFFGITNAGCKETTVEEIPIQLLECNNLSAILYPATFVESDMIDKNKLVCLLKSYQATLETLRPTNTVLPVQLGTLSFKESEIKQILIDHHSTLYSLISRLKGKEEFELQVMWNNLSQVLKRLSTSQEFISAIQKRFNPENGKAIQFEDQIYAGKLLANALEEKRKKITEETITALGPYSFNFKTLPIAEESLAAHISFLVDSSKEEVFYNELDKFSESGEYGQILKFRSVGPLVPYDYATISVTYLSSADIENFRSLLNLQDDLLSEKILKNQMRELALICHPDKDKSKEDLFKKMIDAYKLLSELINMEPLKTIELSKYKDRYVLTIPNLSPELALV